MRKTDRKQHWEDIYRTKRPDEVSWFQPVPATSLDFLNFFNIPTTARIIDIGGGDSFFVDCLLDAGYHDITVVDISEAALIRAQQRLGNRAARVKWIVEDIATFAPTGKFDFWHDRAAFHFLTGESEIEAYINTVRRCIPEGGFLVIGAFSEKGPKKCSGLEISQYSEDSMSSRFGKYFEKIKCVTANHKTPFDTVQNFIFCGFRRLQTILQDE
ncbi:MAG: class I SAM-dependent methyltransferase [Bacteroidales bacterium]|nr:class I SAM-dependent methyltransferase [Bacteroidales bacterium]